MTVQSLGGNENVQHRKPQSAHGNHFRQRAESIVEHFIISHSRAENEEYVKGICSIAKKYIPDYDEEGNMTHKEELLLWQNLIK